MSGTNIPPLTTSPQPSPRPGAVPPPGGGGSPRLGNGDSPRGDPPVPATPSSLPKIRPLWQVGLLNVMGSAPVNLLLTIVTIYALYAEDVKTLNFKAACSQSSCIHSTGGQDPGFAGLNMVCFALFTIEFIVNVMVKDNYFRMTRYEEFAKEENKKLPLSSRIDLLMPGSFYFWLDLVSTVTLILDFPVVSCSMGACEHATISSGSASAGSSNVFNNPRLSKASRVGARAGRVVKVIRMVRLIRLVKLFKYSAAAPKPGAMHKTRLSTSEQRSGRNSASPSPPSRTPSPPGGQSSSVTPLPSGILAAADDDDGPHSHVGTEMTERTTKTVIVGVLTMLIVIPNLQFATSDGSNLYLVSVIANQRYEAANYFQFNGKDCSDDRYVQLTGLWKNTEKYITEHSTVMNMHYFKYNDVEPPLIEGGACGEYADHVESPDRTAESMHLRESEFRRVIYYTGEGDSKTEADFDMSDFNAKSAAFSIGLTTAIVFLLGSITAAFTHDVNVLVLRPIEQMVALVKEITENPLKREFESVSKDKVAHMTDGMETTIILQTITKIAGLMRIGFGEAGAEIIGRNLTNSTSSGMNVLGDGTKIDSIFGFCDIRNFTDTTECLQEEVMLFVNRIAYILHGIVVQCLGAANKNIGDAFLLSWKVDLTEICPRGKQEFVADLALLSLLKTVAEMDRNEEFICNFTPSALAVLYERMPGYKCKIGCGLHMGWAIEGAIGSNRKIDATYISPHVQWAEFLESSTKEYGVPVLMSEPFFNLVTPTVKNMCRKVDNIKRSAKDEVTALFCYDVDPHMDYVASKASLQPQKTRASLMSPTTVPDGTAKGKTRKSIKDKDPRRAKRRDEDDAPKVKTNNLGNLPSIVLAKYTTACWFEDPDLVGMRAHVTDELRAYWSVAIEAFIAGDWREAKKLFKEYLDMTDGRDGPAKNILGHMENDYEGGECPADWKGYRDDSST